MLMTVPYSAHSQGQQRKKGERQKVMDDPPWKVALTLRPSVHSQSCALCRVSARAELSLRQRLSQREDRISELKDALAAAKGNHSGERYAPHEARLSCPRPCFTSARDHPESYPRRAALPPRDGVQHQQHAALGTDSVDEEDVTHARRSPPSRAAAPEQNEEQHEAADHGTSFKLPYFQPKAHAAAEAAQPSLATSLQGSMQQTAVAHAEYAVKPGSQARTSSQDPPSQIPKT